MVDNKMLYDDELFKAGLWRVSDMFDSSGLALGFDVWKRRGVCKSKFLFWRSLISKVRSVGITFVRKETFNDNARIIYFTKDDKVE